MKFGEEEVEKSRQTKKRLKTARQDHVEESQGMKGNDVGDIEFESSRERSRQSFEGKLGGEIGQRGKSGMNKMMGDSGIHGDGSAVTGGIDKILEGNSVTQEQARGTNRKGEALVLPSVRRNY